MYTKFFFCFIFFYSALFVTPQRINTWESQNNYDNGNSGFSSWSSNTGNDIYSTNQNSGTWNLNSPNKAQSNSNFGSSPWASNSFKGNTDYSLNENQNSFDSNWKNYEKNTPSQWSGSAFSDNKKPITSQWDLNKSATTKRPQKQSSNNGNSGNWQSNAFSNNNNNNNNKPKQTKISQSSNKWESKYNTISSNFGDNNYNSVSSSWGSSNSNKPSSNSNDWGSNSIGSDNNQLSSNDIYSTDYEDNDVNSNNNNGFKDNSSFNKKWKSTSTNFKKNKNNDSKQKPNNKKTSNDKYSSNNSENTGFNSFSKGEPNEQKPGISTYEENNGKTERPNVSQNKKNTTNVNQILDELDKNDWYFKEGSNFPNPPFKSTINIDVSELWNADKYRQNGKSDSTNEIKRRKYRETENTEIECYCVNVNLCDEEDMIITQRDIKGDWRPLESFQCEDLTEVCCTNPKIKNLMRANMKNNNPEEKKQEFRHCGQRKVRNEFDEPNDDIVQQEEFPWSLKLQDSTSEAHCSASLIFPKMAVTVASCFESLQKNDLKASTSFLNPNNEYYQSRDVKKVIVHPDYNKDNPRNDIALLVFENPFELTDKVNTICLPITNDKWDSNECLVADSKPENINGDIFEVPRKEVISFLEQFDCQNIMLVTDLWRNYVLHDSFVCGFGKTKKYSCLGEEGSAVICPSKKLPGTFLQIGIVSNGINCDNFGRPGIFTNVLKFLDWINENAFELDLIEDMFVRSLL